MNHPWLNSLSGLAVSRSGSRGSRSGSSSRGSRIRSRRSSSSSSLGFRLLAKDLLQASSLVSATAVLLLLDVGESASLGVNVLDLARALSVELDNLTAGVGAAGLLKVRVETREEVVGAVAEAVALVGGASTVSSMVLLV